MGICQDLSLSGTSFALLQKRYLTPFLLPAESERSHGGHDAAGGQGWVGDAADRLGGVFWTLTSYLSGAGELTSVLPGSEITVEFRRCDFWTTQP